MWINLTKGQLDIVKEALANHRGLASANAEIVREIELLMSGDQDEDEKWVDKARELKGSDGSVEFDPGATVSRGSGPGAYVMGWFWVANEDMGLAGCEDCGEYHPVEKLIDGFCDNCADEDEGDSDV